MKYLGMAIVLMTLALSSNAKDFLITEKNILNQLKKNSPSLKEIEASFLNSQIQKESLKDRLGFELYGGAQYNETKEKALNNFQPVFSPVRQYKLGVKKYTKYGLVLDLNRSIDMRTSSSKFDDLTTTSDEFGLQLDLWKNFLGAVTKAQLTSLEKMTQKDKLQAEISKSTLFVNARRLYFQILANIEKTRISKRLYSTAIKQVKNARKRKANSVSDKAEVARFESLVHQRKGNLLLLSYEKEVLYKNLREILPNLLNQKLKLGTFNLDKISFDVIACSAQINQQTSVPYQYTKYDEVITLLGDLQKQENKVNQSYDDIDLKLDLKFRRVGVGSVTSDNQNFTGSYQGSLDDMYDNDRSGFSAGIQLVIPFGEDKSGTAKIKELYTEKQFEAHIAKMKTNVEGTHRQVKNSVKILKEVIDEQRKNSIQLSIRVREMKKKYAQARIPEYALIQDEDSLLQSDLAIVDTKLRIINTILDYLAVFNTFPCSFNRGVQ